MFGPTRTPTSGSNQQHKIAVGSPAAQPKTQTCAAHSVVKNIPAKPKQVPKQVNLTRQVQPERTTRIIAKPGRVTTDPALQGLAVRPEVKHRARTPYLGDVTPAKKATTPQSTANTKGTDLEIAKQAARKLHSARRQAVHSAPRQEGQLTTAQRLAAHESMQGFDLDIQQKRPKFSFKLFNMSANELRVFAAGVFFASGLIVLGFYMGVSNPGASAQPETYQVEVIQERANGQPSVTETVDVEVDSGIDIEDVDWRPPMPITAEMPARLIIPKFDTNAPVRSLGLTRSGALAVPNYTNQVGWYDQSALPGSPGTVVMDGHYGIPAGSAVFGRFGELVTGDVVQVKRGDGQVLSYAIEEISSYAIGDVPMDRLIASDGNERLNLITCSGGWSKEAHTYDSRTIVFAKRI